MKKNGFLVFLVIYFLPYLGGFDLNERMTSILLLSIHDSVLNPSFSQPLLLVLLTHAVTLLLCWPVYRVIHTQLQERLSVGATISVLASAALMWFVLYGWNQVLFPTTRHRLFSEVVVFPLVIATTFAFVALLCCSLAHFFRDRRLHAGYVALGGAVLIGVLGSSLGYSRSVSASADKTFSGRNVFIIGVDSLSQRVLTQHSDAMPNLQRYLQNAVRYSNAWSPAGRTCPTWFSIFSGRTPAEHGGVFNLRGIERVDPGGMFPKYLQKAGYATIFGLDERRFCNIDESFGFDRVVGPAHGALDFMIQKFNDAPIVNALLQVSWSKYILPHSRLNVAAQASYSSGDFVEEVLSAARDQSGPLFMAVHFESAHFPFLARDARQILTHENKFRADHVNALTVVDAQIEQLVSGLQSSGLLNDALVVFVSDHGESFGDPISVRRMNGVTDKIVVYGHGTSVLAAEQNHVLMAFAEFRNGRPVSFSSDVHDMVSLLDVKGVVEQYVNRGGDMAIDARDCVMAETGVRLAALADYNNIDAARAAEIGATYYAIDSMARMHVREEMMSSLISEKDVTARCGELLTHYEASTKQFATFKEVDGGLVEVPLSPLGHQHVKDYLSQLRDVPFKSHVEYAPMLLP